MVHARIGFDYVAPETLDAALLTLRRNPDAVIIAGGTDLLPRWRSGLIQPDLLIDLKRLGLNRIEAKAGRVCIGASTTISQMMASELLNGQYPALIDACKQIAAPPIRNRGTLGGNLVNASPAADTAPPLLAYDAELVLVKEGCKRIVPLAEFYRGPGKTIMEHGELLTEVQLPINHRYTASKFLKLGNRQAMAIAVASVAVQVSLDGNDEVLEARIALGSVASTPIRAREAESILVGKPLSEETISRAATIAQGEASPISDLRAGKEYRGRMVTVLVRRALKAARAELIGRKPGE